MRRIVPIALAAAVVGLAATQAQAAFTVTVIPAPNFLNAGGTGAGTATNINPTLAATGYAAYVVRVTADSGDRIGTVELANDLLGTFGGASNVGIIGPVHQNYQFQDEDTTVTPPKPAGTYATPFGWAATSGSNPNAAASSNGTDSFFLNSGYYSVAKLTPGETPNPPGAGPLDATDDPFTNDTGIGTRMFFTGASASASTNLTLNLAYVILKWDNYQVVTARGYIINANNFATPFNIVVTPLDPPPVYPPEPGTLGVLALGGLGLLARRRRSA